MWSVFSCPLSDRLVCSPAVLLFPSSLFSAFCVLFSSCFGDSGRLHQQSLPSPLQSPRYQGLLILSETHNSDCPVNSLSALYNKLFTAFATGFRIYYLTYTVYL